MGTPFGGWDTYSNQVRKCIWKRIKIYCFLFPHPTKNTRTHLAGKLLFANSIFMQKCSCILNLIKLLLFFQFSGWDYCIFPVNTNDSCLIPSFYGESRRGIINEFEHQSCFCIHFRINTLEKGTNLLILPVIDSTVSLLFFSKDGFGIK